MTGISSTLSLNDGMSGVLQNIYNSMQPMIRAMEHIQGLMGENAVPSFVDEVTSGFVESTHEAQALADNVEMARRALEHLPESMEVDSIKTDIEQVAMLIEGFDSTLDIQAQKDQIFAVVKELEGIENLLDAGWLLNVDADFDDVIKVEEQIKYLKDIAENIQGNIDIDYSSVDNAKKAVGNIPPEVGRASRETQQFAQEAQNAKRQWSLIEKIVGGFTITRLIGQVRNFFQSNKAIADTYNLKLAQINMMNDGLQSNAELQRMIMASANRVNAEFTMMAGTIYKLEMAVGDLFANNRSIIQFAETIKQTASISATGAQGIEMSFRAFSRSMEEGRMSIRDFDLAKRYIRGKINKVGLKHDNTNVLR